MGKLRVLIPSLRVTFAILNGLVWMIFVASAGYWIYDATSDIFWILYTRPDLDSFVLEGLLVDSVLLLLVFSLLLFGVALPFRRIRGNRIELAKGVFPPLYFVFVLGFLVEQLGKLVLKASKGQGSTPIDLQWGLIALIVTLTVVFGLPWALPGTWGQIERAWLSGSLGKSGGADRVKNYLLSKIP